MEEGEDLQELSERARANKERRAANKLLKEVDSRNSPAFDEETPRSRKVKKGKSRAIDVIYDGTPSSSKRKRGKALPAIDDIPEEQPTPGPLHTGSEVDSTGSAPSGLNEGSPSKKPPPKKKSKTKAVLPSTPKTSKADDTIVGIRTMVSEARAISAMGGSRVGALKEKHVLVDTYVLRPPRAFSSSDHTR